MLARQSGARDGIVPACNAAEAAAVDGIRVTPAETLAQVVEHLSGSNPLQEATLPPFEQSGPVDDSFAHIRGQFAAKRALIVAAAGGHNALMNGSPGSGKTLLARSIVGLLPPLNRQEAIEVAKIHSSVGLLRGPVHSLARPFWAPHHTASPAAIVGGGTSPRPGQVSLAHRGVLFLDELPEFARNVLESLRQPLEDGIVAVSRAAGTLVLPAKFMLVAAMNPCPCGNAGDPTAICVCSPAQITKYAKKVSGPLLDRIDVQVYVSHEKVHDGEAAPNTDIGPVREAVRLARERQLERFQDSGLVTNSEISHRNIDRYCEMEPAGERLLQSVVNSKHLSLRAYHKIKKIARTVADLAGSERIGEAHAAEAIGLRVTEGKRA
jgi:magnesium chelatase family protein